MADPEVEARGAVKRRRRESRGARGAEGVGCEMGDWVSPSPLGKRSVLPPHIFFIFRLKMADFGAFWMLFLQTAVI